MDKASTQTNFQYTSTRTNVLCDQNGSVPTRTLYTWYPQQLRNSLVRFVVQESTLSTQYTGITPQALIQQFTQSLDESLFVFALHSNKNNCLIPVTSDDDSLTTDEQLNAWKLSQRKRIGNQRSLVSGGVQLNTFGNVIQSSLCISRGATLNTTIAGRVYILRDYALQGSYDRESFIRSIAGKSSTLADGGIKITMSTTHSPPQALTSNAMVEMNDEYGVEDMELQDLSLEYTYDIANWYISNGITAPLDTLQSTLLQPDILSLMNAAFSRGTLQPTIFISPSFILGASPWIVQKSLRPQSPFVNNNVMWQATTANYDSINIQCPAPQSCVDEVTLTCEVEKINTDLYVAEGGWLKFIHVYEGCQANNSSGEGMPTETTFMQDVPIFASSIVDPQWQFTNIGNEWMTRPKQIVSVRVPQKWNMEWRGTLIYLWHVQGDTNNPFQIMRMRLGIKRNSNSDAVIFFMDQIMTPDVISMNDASYEIQQQITSVVYPNSAGKQEMS